MHHGFRLFLLLVGLPLLVLGSPAPEATEHRGEATSPASEHPEPTAAPKQASEHLASVPDSKAAAPHEEKASQAPESAAQVQALSAHPAARAPSVADARVPSLAQGEQAPAAASHKPPPTVVAPSHGPAADSVGPEEAWQRLLSGNQRFVNGNPAAHMAHAAKRASNVKGQHPFAIIVCCSDSRVGPEVVFDQSIGDLFVVRTAGHVVGEIALGSIEYAAEHLGTRLILVLGHEGCGAVNAASTGKYVPPHVGYITLDIQASLARAKRKGGNLQEALMREHVAKVVGKLRTAKPVLEECVQKGKLSIRGARYDLDTGLVEEIEVPVPKREEEE